MAADLPRKFTLLDGMVLIAAVALGCGVLKSAGISVDGLKSILSNKSDLGYSGVFVFLTVPIAVPLTVATVVLRLRKPRPPRRRLTRQPGLVVCSVASVVAAPMASVLAVIISKLADTSDATIVIAGATALLVGVAVIASWMTLVLNRNFRPERSWIDRFGRLLGFYWIATLGIVVWFIAKQI
jgi:hypothetical protein